MYRTAIYCRTTQKDEAGITRQTETLRDYAERHGYNDTEVYADDGFNGNTMSRPALLRLNKDIANHRINKLIVESVFNVSGDEDEIRGWLFFVRHNGVSFTSVVDEIADDTYCNIYDILSETCRSCCMPVGQTVAVGRKGTKRKRAKSCPLANQEPPATDDTAEEAAI